MRSGLAAPSAPGVSRASSSARRPATIPNWLNRSSWRAVFGGIQASGSKSSTWAATWERNGRRVEAVDPLDRRARRAQTGPERVDARADRR